MAEQERGPRDRALAWVLCRIVATAAWGGLIVAGVPGVPGRAAAQPAPNDSTAAAPRNPARIEDIDASQPIPLHPTLPLFLHVQPQPPPPRAFTSEDEQELLAGLQGPQESGDDEFRPEAPETSIELALAPYSWSVPDISQKILRQRQINDVVILQCLIGPTGKVQRVRVLRGIPDCPECTKSARLAAQKFVYRAPPPQPHIRETWTTPFEMRFTAGKRVRVRR